jgi:hypothetical protein
LTPSLHSVRAAGWWPALGWSLLSVFGLLLALAAGMKAARAQRRLLCGTWEPLASMPRENSKRRTREEPSTDARRRDGRARSSEEPW